MVLDYMPDRLAGPSSSLGETHQLFVNGNSVCCALTSIISHHSRSAAACGSMERALEDSRREMVEPTKSAWVSIMVGPLEKAVGAV